MTTSKTSPRKLTAKQEKYCKNRVNGMNMSDSYRDSYTGTKMTKKQINEEACKLDKNPKVVQRLDELYQQKDKAFIRSTVSLRSKVLNKLELFMDSATPQDSSKIRAAELLGKSMGLFTDVIDDKRKDDKTPEELKRLLLDKLAELRDDEEPQKLKSVG